MQMKEYLVETFQFNDHTNKRMLVKIAQLPAKDECIKYFSHLINSQIRWLERIRQYPANPQLDWWLPVYKFDELEEKWNNSLQDWINFIQDKTEAELFSDVDFIGYNGSHFTAQLKDIALQLNYHSIHHRAQMQIIIRQQGLEPDFIDYIGTRYRKVS